MRERARWKEHEHNLTWAFQNTYSNIFNKYATYVTAFFFPLVTNEKLKVAALVRKHQHIHTNFTSKFVKSVNYSNYGDGAKFLGCLMIGCQENL